MAEKFSLEKRYRVGNQADDDFQVVFTPDQMLRAIVEDAITELDGAASMVGRIHRVAITDDVLPSFTQLQYLIKAANEITEVLTFLTDLSAKNGRSID